MKLAKGCADEDEADPPVSVLQTTIAISCAFPVTLRSAISTKAAVLNLGIEQPYPSGCLRSSENRYFTVQSVTVAKLHL